MSNDVNTVGDFLRSVFPTLVNKNGKIFNALVANRKETGTIERIFSDLEKTRETWINNFDFYNQDGELFEKTLSFFSFLTWAYNESDESLKNRNELLFYRSGDTLWGDIWNIRRLFQRYFNTEYVYIVNNTNPVDENILLDGNFEIQNNSWTLESCAYDNSAKLSGKSGVKFHDKGICQQVVSVKKDATYFLHFFLKGTIAVQIKDNNNRYWDSQAGEFGNWVTNKKSIQYSSEEWSANSVYFLTNNETVNISIIFEGMRNESTYLDYVRLFLKGAYPSFSLIVILPVISYNEKEAFSFAPGKNDINMSIYYEKMSYIEQTQILGMTKNIANDIYTKLLEMVKAGGITSYVEILIEELD